jgi:transposase
VVECLDLSAIEAVYEAELRGRAALPPGDDDQALALCICVGVTSSRRLAKLVQRDVGVMMLAAGNRPDFRTLNTFRERHLKDLAGLFKQVLKLCRRKGLLELKHVAIDGTKLRANASKHTAMSYGRMKDEDARISKEIEAWFREADKVDAAEDREYGEEQGDELPPGVAERGPATPGDQGSDGRVGEGGPGARQRGAAGQGPAQLHRLGVQDHEIRRGSLHPGLQRTGGGGRQAPDHRRSMAPCKYTALGRPRLDIRAAAPLSPSVTRTAC